MTERKPQLTDPERLLLEVMRDHPGRSVFTHHISDYTGTDVVASLIEKGLVERVAGTYQHDEYLKLTDRRSDQ